MYPLSQVQILNEAVYGTVNSFVENWANVMEKGIGESFPPKFDFIVKETW